MATAGRILIMPKGAYNQLASYKMLDLVSFNGNSWCAKKNVTGVEPNEGNSEFWHKMTDIVTIQNNLSARTPGEALDATQGRILNEKIVANTNAIGEVRDSLGEQVTFRVEGDTLYIERVGDD